MLILYLIVQLAAKSIVHPGENIILVRIDNVAGKTGPSHELAWRNRFGDTFPHIAAPLPNIEIPFPEIQSFLWDFEFRCEMILAEPAVPFRSRFASFIRCSVTNLRPDRVF